MTLTSTTLKNVYTGDDVVSVFAYAFKIFANTEIIVTEKLIASPFTETVLVLTTDYTVSDVGTATGGNVTLVAGALASTKKLIIQRNHPLTQTLDLVENDSAPSGSYETAWDRVVMQIQQLQEQLDRVILQDITQTTTLAFPVPEASKGIAWDSAGTALENVTLLTAASVDAAAASAAAAATSETNAATSETNSSNSAAAAAASAASINLPAIGAAGNILVTNAGATGYDSTNTIANLGTDSALIITANTSVLAGGAHALEISSEVANVNADSALVKISQVTATSTEPALEIDYNGIGDAAIIDHSGILNTGTHALLVNGTGVTVAADSALVKIVQDSSTASEPALEIDNDGTGAGIEIDSNIGHALFATNAAVLSTTKHLIYAYSNVANVAADAALVKIHQDNAAATEPALEIINDGTGEGILLDQVTILASGKSALRITSNVAHVNADSALVKITQDEGTASEPCLQINNDGTGPAIEIDTEDATGTPVFGFTSSMGGDSGKDPSAVAEDDWIEIDFGGTAFFIPVYAAS